MCNVRWGNIISQPFNVKNGVRQGAVSSPVLFCVYINDLIIQLRNLKVGCQLNCVYLGIWVYADDIILSPSRSGLQLMTNVCKKLSSLHQLKFSTNVDVSISKTKCIVFSNPVKNTDNICPILLNNLPLPYVTKILATHCSLMTKDVNCRRAKLISKIHSLNQEFHYANTSTVLKLCNNL